MLLLDRDPERLPLPNQMLLSDDLVDGLRAYAVGERFHTARVRPALRKSMKEERWALTGPLEHRIHFLFLLHVDFEMGVRLTKTTVVLSKGCSVLLLLLHPEPEGFSRTFGRRERKRRQLELESWVVEINFSAERFAGGGVVLRIIDAGFERMLHTKSIPPH